MKEIAGSARFVVGTVQQLQLDQIELEDDDPEYLEQEKNAQIPPPQSSWLKEKKSPVTDDNSEVTESPQRLKGSELYRQAHELINSSLGTQSSTLKKAYRILDEAASLYDHTESQELTGFAYLFGDYLPWNPRKAQMIFENLTTKGSPRGQVGLAFLHTAGVGVNSSQAKALVYFTFAALGEL